MSKIDNTPKVTDNEKSNIQRGAIGHRATWMALTYLAGKDAGMAAEAEKFAREGIAKTGYKDGCSFLAKCSDGPNCAELKDIFLSDITRASFEIDFINCTEDRLDMEFHHCPLLKAWQDLGLDDETCALLCDVAMEGDRNIAKGMGLDFHLGDTLAEGKSTCQVSFFKKK